MENNSGDIERFVKSEVDRLISKRLLLDGKVPSKLKCKTIETLTNGAQGMFRWVQMSLEALKQTECIPDFKDALGKLPSELSGLYDIIHAQIYQIGTHGRDVATQTLKWLLCAQRLLSAEELIAAVYQVEDDMSSDSEEDFELGNEQSQSCENDILRLCRNLVVLDSDNSRKRHIRFAHQSVREYLLQKPQYIAMEQHILATERCLDIYLTNCLESPIAQEMERRNKVLRPYAEVYWPVHYKHVEDSKYNKVVKEELRFTGRVQGRSLPYVQWILDILEPYPEVYQSMQYKHTENSKSIEVERKVLQFIGKTQGTPIPYVQWVSKLRSSYKIYRDGFDLNRKLGLDFNDRLGQRISFVKSQPDTDTILALACAFGIPSLLPGHELSKYNTQPFLFVAAREGHDQIVRMLLDEGADVNTPKWNALIAACSQGHDQIVQMLLDRGADVNIQDQYYMTALSRASFRGYNQIVQMLLDRGANVKIHI